MSKYFHIAVILWAWACWAWVAYSHQWLWLIASVIPYFIYTSVSRDDGNDKLTKRCNSRS
jgi:hypothetical protein